MFKLAATIALSGLSASAVAQTAAAQAAPAQTCTLPEIVDQAPTWDAVPQ